MHPLCWKGEIKYLGLIGIPLLYTALTRKCLINRLLGINSCKL
ncbi:YgaP family membrane protein [Paenibacillus ehimensis]